MIVSRTKDEMLRLEQGHKIIRVDLSRCCKGMTSSQITSLGLRLCVCRQFNECDSYNAEFVSGGLNSDGVVQFLVPSYMDTAKEGRYEYEIKDAKDKVHQKGALMLVCPRAQFSSDDVSTAAPMPVEADGEFDGECSGGE